MAKKVAVIDTNQKLVALSATMTKEMERAGAPSPYFEELWYSLVKYLEEIDTRLTNGGL